MAGRDGTGELAGHESGGAAGRCRIQRCPPRQGFSQLDGDTSGVPTTEDLAQQERFQVGRDVAITPGKVVHRNRLVELIRYDAQTATRIRSRSSSSRRGS